MEKRTIISSYISLIGFVVLIVLRIILAFKIYNFYGFNMRQVYGFVSLGIYIPILMITTIATCFVIFKYFINKFKKPLKHLYFVIPSIVYILICIFVFFQTLCNHL